MVGPPGWRDGPALPGPRSDLVVAWDEPRDRLVVAAGGIGPREPIAETLVLDLTRDTWSTAAPLEHPRSGAAGTVVGPYLLVMGGLKPSLATSDLVQALHLPSLQWRALPSLPRPLAWSRAVSVGTEVHLVGGWTVLGPEQERAVDAHYVLSVGPEGAEGEWREAPPLPQPTFGGLLFHRDEELLWVGGSTRMGWPSPTAPSLYLMSVTPNVWAFDLDSERWTSRPPLASGCRMAVGVSSGGAVGQLGGLDGRPEALSSTYWLGPDGSWREGPGLPAPRHHAAGVRVGEELWVMGGDLQPTPPPTWRIPFSDLVG